MAISPNAPVHRLSFDDVVAMLEAGILTESDRLELEGGVLVEMMPNGGPHGRRVQWLTRYLVGGTDASLAIRVQDTFLIPDGGYYEPDLVVVQDLGDDLPRTALLVVEVSVTSRARDVEKAATYAAAEVGEYWIVDVERSEVLVHTEPRTDGYAVVRRCLPGEEITPPAGLPPVAVASVLG